MSKKSESKNGKKKQKGNGNVVELRSDVVNLEEHGEKYSKSTIILLVSAIIGGLVIGIGAFAAFRYIGAGVPTGEGGGFFGSLPSGNDRNNAFATPEPAPTPQVMGRYTGTTCTDPNRRAVGVMLAGDPINRPVSSFSKADTVYELPVLVSGVTRLLAVFQCGQPADIGSVRSARHDYLFLGEGLDLILGHWGGSYHALNRINAGEFETINALSNPYSAFFRKNNLPRPYNGFTTYEGLWNALQKLGYRTTTEWSGYEFQDDIPSDQRPSGGVLSIAWPGQYRVHYEYDPTTNRYQRYWAGIKQVDGEDGALVAPSSVAIMRATNEFAQGPGGYNDVGIEGEGDLMVYQDGKAIPGRWRKDERYRSDPVQFMNEHGDPIRFTRGQVWVMAVEPNVDVTWEPK